jgi:hypothetical protein
MKILNRYTMLMVPDIFRLVDIGKIKDYLKRVFRQLFRNRFRQGQTILKY